MAIAVKAGADTRYLLIEQGTFGIAEIDSVAGTELDVDHFTVTPDFKVREFAGAHGARWKESGDVQTDTKGSTPGFTLAGPARNSVDQMLYAFFQSVTEGGLTPFSKTFNIHATQPDFSANAGHFITLIGDNGASNSIKVHSAVSSGLTLSCNPGEVLQVSSEFKAMGAPTHNATPTGVYTREQGNIWHFEDIDRITIDFGGGAVIPILMGFEISLTQDLTPLSPDGTGSYQTFGMLNKNGTFKLNTHLDANHVTAAANAAGNTPITVRLGWGNATPGTDNGDMDIQFTGKIENVIDTKDDIRMTEITGRMVATGSTSPVTIVMANALDRVW